MAGIQMRDFDTATSVRETWDFTYKTSDVLDAAGTQHAYHSGRYSWWELELKQAEKSLKEKGFEYREEQFSRGADMVIVGDPQLVKRVTDCRRKMDEHRANQQQYASWMRALDGKAKQDADSKLVLKIDGVVFFDL